MSAASSRWSSGHGCCWRRGSRIGRRPRSGAALALWRGAPLDQLDGWLPARSEAARLEELRRTAEEDWLDARLAAGDHRQVAAEAEAMVDAEPLRERRWASLALAQYRCARQADALRSLARARQVLVEQLGLSPGPELTALEAAILRQDPALAAVAEPAAVSGGLPVQGSGPVRRGRRRLVLRSRRRDGGLCGAPPRPPAPGRRRSVGVRQVVARPRRCGPGAAAPRSRRHRRRAGQRPACDRARDPGGRRRTVVVVDQFEELFALGHPPDTVSDLCRALVAHAAAVASSCLAVRSDRLGDLSGDAELSRLVERGLHLVTPLAGDALRQAIEQPAQLAGLRLEHGLVELLVRDCEENRAACRCCPTPWWRRGGGATAPR